MAIFPDLIALLLLFLGTAISARLLWRNNIRGWNFFSMVWLAFYGLAISTMMLGHNTENLYQAAESTTWTYDFRFYSLQLLGILLIGCGIRYLWAVIRLTRGEVAGRRMALVNTMVVLAIVLPLIPLQPLFAGILTGLGIITLLVLMLMKPKHSLRK